MDQDKEQEVCSACGKADCVSWLGMKNRQLFRAASADGVCFKCGRELCCLSAGWSYCPWCGKHLKEKANAGT